MTHGSFFSGIGGFDLAAEWMGWTNVFHVEWEDFPRKVLKYYWPEADSYGDIRKTNFKKYAGKIDIVSGGFPCQPYSAAGKRLGKEDDRHLWPEYFRAIKEIQPRWVVGENVYGLINWSGGLVFDEVQADLESAGYEVWAYVLPAAGVNAPHRRDRVWFVAYRTPDGTKRPTPDTERIRPPREEHGQAEPGQPTKTHPGCGWQNFPTEPPVCGRNDGISERMDGITFSKWRNESIKAYGNAIVPQVALQIFKAIQQYENEY
jgi:DNA (cytosine-5)-methyltransferase 1